VVSVVDNARREWLIQQRQADIDKATRDAATRAERERIIAEREQVSPPPSVPSGVGVIFPGETLEQAQQRVSESSVSPPTTRGVGVIFLLVSL